jgi:polygalacturonase
LGTADHQYMHQLGFLLVVCCAAAAAPQPRERLLQGSYPDFHAAPYHAPVSQCDVTAVPWSAAGDGVTDDTLALQRCIEKCPRDSTGSFAVVLEEGKRFLTGSLNLTSGCHLVVDGRLLGSTDPASYPVIPPLAGYGPGQRDNAQNGWGRHQALLSGWNMSDVVVTGSGVIDGQGLVTDPKLGTSWVTRFHNHKTCESKKNCRSQPPGSVLDFGRPRVWEPMFSSRVSLVNVSITNQAFWCVHPYGCDDVLISNVNISAPRDEGIPNDDGIDPDSTSNVLVEDCWVSVGDNR